VEQRDISVLVVEDDSMARSWIRRALEDTEFRVAGEAATLMEAAHLVEARGPALLLIDYQLGGDAGTALLRDLRAGDVTVPALLMTANPRRGFNEAAREASAQGTLLKTGSVEELLTALRVLAQGETTFDSRHPRRSAGRAALSPREREVLKSVAGGATNREIAEALDIGEETVKTLVTRVFQKLGVHKRAEAVSAAHEQGLL
jgi:DNA-binding NarL/FixJ family response regulator